MTMQANKATAVETVHRLLLRALLEIRSQGNEDGNKLVFRLADLFHNVVLEMENAAEGRCGYEDVLHFLEERAKENGCEKWLSSNLADLNQ